MHICQCLKDKKAGEVLPEVRELIIESVNAQLDGATICSCDVSSDNTWFAVRLFNTDVLLCTGFGVDLSETLDVPVTACIKQHSHEILQKCQPFFSRYNEKMTILRESNVRIIWDTLPADELLKSEFVLHGKFYIASAKGEVAVSTNGIMACSSGSFMWREEIGKNNCNVEALKNDVWERLALKLAEVVLA